MGMSTGLSHPGSGATFLACWRAGSVSIEVSGAWDVYQASRPPPWPPLARRILPHVERQADPPLSIRASCWSRPHAPVAVQQGDRARWLAGHETSQTCLTWCRSGSFVRGPCVGLRACMNHREDGGMPRIATAALVLASAGLLAAC